jgi:dephospho-CoA kinase
MLKVGITGNIGSGKSFICRLFAMLGVPVYHADERAKELLVTSTDVRQAVKALLGNEAYLEDGCLNRSYIASRVFAEQDLLEKYNAIIHPAVATDYRNWLLAHDTFPYTLKEAALIFEANSHKELDLVICVTAPESLRLKRVMDRDGATEESVKARMDKQWKEERKASMSDRVIFNDGSQPVIQAVWELHHEFLTLSRSDRKVPQ